MLVVMDASKDDHRQLKSTNDVLIRGIELYREEDK